MGKRGILGGFFPTKQRRCPKDRRLVPGTCDIIPIMLTKSRGGTQQRAEVRVGSGWGARMGKISALIGGGTALKSKRITRIGMQRDNLRVLVEIFWIFAR